MGKTMKIAVVSDSHDNLGNIRRAVEDIKKRQLNVVVHAGDIISPFALKLFQGLKLYAVFGNNDGERLLLSKIAEKYGFTLEEQPLFLTLEGYRVAVIHGVDGADKTHRFAYALAKSDEFDAVIYGHLHEAEVKRIGSTLVLNPGELSGYLSGKASYAVLDLEELSAEIVLLK